MQLRTKKLLAAAAALALAPLAQANLVTNGGFETGDLSGWTVTPAGVGSNLGVTSGAQHSGVFSVAFGAGSALDDVMSQTLATTAGATYDISFWLRTNDLGDVNSFSFNWDGGAAELDLTNAPTQVYTRYTYSLVASSSSTTISFAGRNRNSYHRLDDVSVTLSAAVPTVPEPGSLALVALAALGAGLALRRRGA